MSEFVSDAADSGPPLPPRPAAAGGSSGANAAASSSASSSSGGDPSHQPTAYKAGGTNDVNALLQKDADDESLARYKAQLLGAAATVKTTDDPRRVVLIEFRVIVEDEAVQDMGFDLSTKENLAAMAKNPFILKEGCKYKFKITFKVQHEIVPGLRFTNVVRRAVFSDTEEVVIGSHAPAAEPHSFLFPRRGWRTAPSGMLMRGDYSGKIRLFDTDNVTHAGFAYKLKIAKRWPKK